MRFQLFADMKAEGQPYRLRHAETGKMFYALPGGLAPSRDRGPYGWQSAKDALYFVTDTLVNYGDEELVWAS